MAADPRPVPEEKLIKLDAEFGALEPQEVSVECLQKLAVDYAFVTGKWIAFALEKDVDREWRKLVNALIKKEMPENVLAIKVNE